jgi:hypothetical protein
MRTRTSHFLERPGTSLGWWAVGLGVSFTLLFLLIVNEVIRFPGMLTMILGVVAGVLTLTALIAKHERSWLVWLVLIPGLFAILFSLGEILVPH